MMIYSCYIIAPFLIIPLNCHEVNTSMTFGVEDKHYIIAKHVAFVLFSIFLLYSIICNVLMTIIFCSRDNYYNSAFVLISSQLIIANFSAILVEAVLLPEILLAKNRFDGYQTTWIKEAFSILKPFTFFSILHFTFLLTLNRFVAIILRKYNAFFESTKLYFLIAFVWFLSAVISMVNYYFCTTSFHVSKMRWERNCTKQSKKNIKIFLSFRQAWVVSLPAIMFFIYIAIFYSIRRKRCSTSDINNTQRSSWIYGGLGANAAKTISYERSMLIQAALICGVLEVGIITFNFLPFADKIFDHQTHISIGLFTNCYNIFSRAMLPTVYLIYSKRARNIAKYLLSSLFAKFGLGSAATVTQNS